MLSPKATSCSAAFARMRRRQACAPGTFLLLGATDPEVIEIHDHHHPQFDIDERALANGVKVISESVVALLQDGKP